MKFGKESQQKESADLWLIDIDGTVAPHLTVGLANKIFLSNFFRLFNKIYIFNRILNTKDSFKIIIKFLFGNLNLKKNKNNNKIKIIKTLSSLSYFGVKLYLIRWYNNIINLFRDCVDNTYLIKTFVKMIKKNNINPDYYSFSTKEIENSLYPGIKKFLKNKKIIAMSQSFCFKGGIELYKKILGIKELHCNNFNKITISTSFVKKKKSLAAIKKYKAKKVGVIANDNIDIEMVKLADFCILNNAPRKLRKYGDIHVKNDYNKIIHTQTLKQI